MSQAETTIVEQRNGPMDVIGLYLAGDKVVFRRHYTPEDPDDEMTIFEEAEFAVDNYRKGIEELKKIGACTIKDECQNLMISVSKERSCFGSMAFTIRSSTFFVEWTADQISLPQPDGNLTTGGA